MLSEKVVVVTGGAGLIGQEFVKSIVENNGIGIIADINIGLAEKVRDNLAQQVNGERIGVVKLDITSEESLEEGIYHLRNKYKRIDALINNAYPRNKNYGQSFFDVQYNDFIENIGLNLGGYFSASQKFAKYFKEQGSGNIINISSIYGVIAPKFEIYKDTLMTTPIEYASTKSALIHLTQYMAKYFKGMNIRVNAISPGGILDNQPQIFLNNYKEKCLTKGMLDKSDLNGTLIYLLSNMSQYVNGQNIIVDDGFCL